MRINIPLDQRAQEAISSIIAAMERAGVVDETDEILINTLADSYNDFFDGIDKISGQKKVRPKDHNPYMQKRDAKDRIDRCLKHIQKRIKSGGNNRNDESGIENFL